MTTDSDWTFVSTKRKGRRPHAFPQDQDGRPINTWPPMCRDLTVDHIAAEFRKKSQIWKSSECCRQVYRILDRLQPGEEWTLTNAVCLGSGSFSRDNLQGRRRSTFQLAVFVDVTAYVQRKCQTKLQVFIQDPAYTRLDIAFLRSLEFTVCTDADNTPDALDYLRPSSFVCELFMERTPAFLQALLHQSVELVLGSMLIDAAEISSQKSRYATKATENELQRTRSPSEKDTGTQPSQDEAQLRFAELEEVYIREYRPYRMPRFEVDPNIFEGLHIAVANRHSGVED